MLETFRKHHYIMMCIIAAVVVISFTFFFNPNKGGGGPAGSGAVLRKLFDTNLTQGDVDLIEQQARVAANIAGQEQSSVRSFMETMSTIVDEGRPVNDRMADADYPINVTIMRLECERLGIAVEKADIEKRIREVEAFQTNGAFDGSKLDRFLSGGAHGDRSATETKLTAVVRDVMLFERMAQLVGGSFAPSACEVDADFAQDNVSVTAATALIQKKDHENQTVTDEEIQKFYDAEKAKFGSTEKGVAADPIILTEEKRAVKYCITEAPKFTEQPPVAPPPVPPLPPKPDFSALPEDQKKAKEEEWKKQEEEHQAKVDAHTKDITEHAGKMTDYQKRQEANTAAKQAWLKQVSDFSSATVSDERNGATFEALAKPLEPAPAPAPVVVPAAPAPAFTPVPEPPAPAPAPAPTPAPAAPEGSAAPVKETPPPAETPGAVKGAPGPAGAEGTPAPAAADTPAPVVAPAPAAPATAEAPAPAAAPAPPVVAPAPPVSIPAPAPLSFVRTASFSTTTAPADINAFAGKEGTATAIIFKVGQGETETFVEGNGADSFLVFQVTGIEKPAVRPLEEVKQKISDKIKAEKVAAALKAAASDARSKILEAVKAGKSFKEAAEANKAVVAELPAISSKTPLPKETPNAELITSTVGIASKDGMSAPPVAGVQPGEVSDALDVPEGLLLVHVMKKELQKFPDADEKKKALRTKRTFHDVGASLQQPAWNQQAGIEAYMAATTEFRSSMGYFHQHYGGTTNPVLKAWFAARRNEAQKAAP